MKLGVCIIGCGAMGKQHANVWKARDDSEILALYDPLEDRRKALAETTDAKTFDSFEGAITCDGVDVVSVCTPVCFHSEVTCFAAEHGKHVLCEKPIALTLEQADAMIRAAKENNVLLSTSFQYRGHGRNVRYRELFHEGAFGGPAFVRLSDIREVRPKLAMHRQSMNGGPVIDMVGHYFDLMRFMTGEEPVSVSARGHVFGRGKERLSGIEDLAIDAADIQVAMSGGHVLNVLVDWGMPEGFPGFQDELLVGPALSIRPVGGEIQVQYPDRVETWDRNAGNLPGPTVRVNDLVNAIREGRSPEVTGDDGRVALSVSLAALESIKTGETVALSTAVEADDYPQPTSVGSRSK